MIFAIPAPAYCSRGGAFGSGRQPPDGEADAISSAVLDRPVLVVEDEAMIAWTLESMLEDLGFTHIRVTASGADAIAAARRETPGLLISDINLGERGIDGVEAAASILGGRPIPVIFISGFASAEARERIGRDLPSATLLRKPIEAEDLRRTIAAATSAKPSH